MIEGIQKTTLETTVTNSIFDKIAANVDHFEIELAQHDNKLTTLQTQP